MIDDDDDWDLYTYVCHRCNGISMIYLPYAPPYGLIECHLCGWEYHTLEEKVEG